MGSNVNRNEIRRLEKAAREKDKSKLIAWMQSFENQIDNNFRRDYELAYQQELNNSVQNALTAIVYALYYSEETYIDKSNLADFMADLFSTLDMFRTGEYTPQEYKDILAKENVFIDEYDHDGIYKKYLNIFDSDLVNYLKHRPRKIITICGSSKFKDEILKVNEDLTINGNMVFLDGVFIHSINNEEILPEERQMLEELQRDKILISDAIYVVNKDGYIGDTTKAMIEYAKEHNKEIIYHENI